MDITNIWPNMLGTHSMHGWYGRFVIIFLCTKRLFASELRVPGTPNNMGYSNYGRRISAENSAFFDDHLMD